MAGWPVRDFLAARRELRLVIDLDYEDKAPYAFTGTVKEVIFDLTQARAEAEVALHAHATTQVIGQGAAG